MKKIIIERLRAEIVEHIKGWRNITIDLPNPPCEPKQNAQCMHNAMNEYQAGRSFAILEVCRADIPMVHYLCVDANGDVYDPTLGYQWSGTKYKLIRYIHPNDDKYMADHLVDAKERLFHDACSKVTKIAFKVARLDLGDII